MASPSVGTGGKSAQRLRLAYKFRLVAIERARRGEMTMPLHEDNGAVRPFLLTQPLHGEWQAILLEVTADLIHASEPGELGRMTFERVSSPFSADICFNYHLDPAGQRRRLVFGCGIPPEHLESAQSLELGQEYCGIVAASCQPIVAE